MRYKCWGLSYKKGDSGQVVPHGHTWFQYPQPRQPLHWKELDQLHSQEHFEHCQAPIPYPLYHWCLSAACLAQPQIKILYNELSTQRGVGYVCCKLLTHHKDQAAHLQGWGSPSVHRAFAVCSKLVLQDSSTVKERHSPHLVWAPTRLGWPRAEDDHWIRTSQIISLKSKPTNYEYIISCSSLRGCSSEENTVQALNQFEEKPKS